MKEEKAGKIIKIYLVVKYLVVGGICVSTIAWIVPNAVEWCYESGEGKLRWIISLSLTMWLIWAQSYAFGRCAESDIREWADTSGEKDIRYSGLGISYLMNLVGGGIAVEQLAENGRGTLGAIAFIILQIGFYVHFFFLEFSK